VAALAAIAAIAALDIFIPRSISGFVGPQAFPLVVAGGLAILGVVLVTRTVIRPRHSTESIGSRRDALVLVAAVAAYLVLFQSLGFLLSTFLLLAGMFYHLGERKIWVTVVVAAGLSLAVTLAFRVGLNVNLPVGPFGL
jgi:putative tricarboxylic transport membrane protein